MKTPIAFVLILSAIAATASGNDLMSTRGDGGFVREILNETKEVVQSPASDGATMPAPQQRSMFGHRQAVVSDGEWTGFAGSIQDRIRSRMVDEGWTIDANVKRPSTGSVPLFFTLQGSKNDRVELVNVVIFRPQNGIAHIAYAEEYITYGAFRDIKTRPNKPPQPTPASVTPTAGAPVTPTSSVAHR
jgi:hypothetical protein